MVTSIPTAHPSCHGTAHLSTCAASAAVALCNMTVMADASTAALTLVCMLPEPIRSLIAAQVAGNGLFWLLQGLPFPVSCCWNGMAVLAAAPFLNGTRFRGNDPEGCPGSECMFICDDFIRAGHTRMVVDPGGLPCTDALPSTTCTTHAASYTNAACNRNVAFLSVHLQQSPVLAYLQHPRVLDVALDGAGFLHAQQAAPLFGL